MEKRGQGTIEYLVIVAIVIVIALVVVGILINLLEQGGGITENSARIAWSSAQPWAISDWSMDATNDNVILVLKNNSANTMELNEVTLSSTDSNTSVNTSVTSTGTQVVYVSATMTAGTEYSYSKSDISIEYNVPATGLYNNTQAGAADIIGTAG